MNLREDQVGVLRSSMSDKTAGMLLGRSPAWVCRARAGLAAPAAIAGGGIMPAEPAASFVADFGCGPGVDPEEAMNRPPRVAPVAEPAPEPLRRSAALGGGVEQLSPVRANVLRYCRWFLAARWSLEDVAGLFDLDPIHLAEALA